MIFSYEILFRLSVLANIALGLYLMLAHMEISELKKSKNEDEEIT